MLRRVVSLTLLAGLLLVGFAGMALASVTGLPSGVGLALAVLGLPVPLITGFLRPAIPGRLLRLYLALAFGAILLVALALIGLRGPQRAWQTATGSAGPMLLFLILSVPALRAGSLLRRQANLRPWLRRSLVGTVVLLLGLLFVGGVYLRGLGLLPFAQGDPEAAYERLWRNMERFYSHWETSPVDPNELKARYRAQVGAAVEACQNQVASCQPYRDVLRDMLAELRDGHTHLQPHPAFALADPGLIVEPIDDQAMITRVVPGSEAEIAGLVPGLVITAVDGVPVKQALQQVSPWAVAYAAPHTRNYYRHRFLLAGPVGQPVLVELAGASGQQQTVTLIRQNMQESQGPVVYGERLPSGMAYIAVHQLWGEGIVGEFDRLVDEMLDAPGLILDLRQNGGGNSDLGDQMVGRLIGEKVIYGSERFLSRNPMHGWSLGGDIEAEPRPPVFQGSIAVLIDTAVASSGEWMAATLCDSGRARCFGRTTAGDSGNPVFFFMPGLTVQFSTGDFRRANGTPLNGVGISPHVSILWTVLDVRLGHDPDLAAADGWLVELTAEDGDSLTFR